MKMNSAEPLLRDGFLGAMRRVACSVAVVTTDGPAGRHGATATAFSSVSADPPTLLVCLHGESRIARMVAGNGRFCLNVLPADARAVADRFAGRHEPGLVDRFSGIEHFGSPGEPPVLDRSAAFTCRVVDEVASGSHRVLFGAVEEILNGLDEPLSYFDGAYRRLETRGNRGGGQSCARMAS